MMILDGHSIPLVPMVLAGLIYVVGLILWVWAITETIKSNETDGAKIAWILVLIFIPVLGLLVWLFAGPRAGKGKG